ncbi:FmdE family protein [Desulfoluna spongiiphila]|uniref:Formylmethanofuran dehydrogenase, subunit E n=1 Tax=Desulfoluna spongiiphila TaxID=419481 RepID=A0A1G5HAI7_9BACT|nr:FmdE family protein [Desulfoluna spongiiphila]SCY60783.1 formylmethanofuran dehydrogenase, subunit E [Desulfoluna spongiiphila]
MNHTHYANLSLPDTLKPCIDFHGHLCPGLVYGYLVAVESLRLLGEDRSDDEELVAISENDACSVDALQVLLGTTAGKGNLTISNIGKNVYTVYSRQAAKGFRFSRRSTYAYTGDNPEVFLELEKKVSAGTATAAEKKQQKLMKTLDLLAKPVEEIFEITDAAIPEPAYAELAPSVACAVCGELTMQTKMIRQGSDLLCRPCAEGARRE